MTHCCTRMAEESERYVERGDAGAWHVGGCCGGGCYVLTDLKFCPFCGSLLSAEMGTSAQIGREMSSDTPDTDQLGAEDEGRISGR